jgi:GTP cyclohydrolase II
MDKPIKHSKADRTVINVEQACNALRRGGEVTLSDAEGGQLSFVAAEVVAPHMHATLLSARENLPTHYLNLQGAEVSLPTTALERAALTLLRMAELLPIATMSTQAMDQSFHLSMQAVNALPEALAENLEEISAASLPLKAISQARVHVFRPRYASTEYLALVIADPYSQKNPLVRVHSSCVTGDLLGSLRCDCGDQLHMAIQQMAAQGGGVICYLHQEGRGIGIANKIRAYALQDTGQDTLEANESLGFAADERHFHIAAAMLRQLGLTDIKLLTNNPAKVEALQALNIHVHQRVPLQAEPTAFNADYLKTKALRFGHYVSVE